MPFLPCFSNEETKKKKNAVDEMHKLGLKQMKKDIRNK